MTYTNIPYSVVDTKNLNFSAGKKSVKRLTENMLHGKALFNYSNQAVRVVPADVLRYVSQTKSLNNNDVYRNSLINFVFSCEKNCAGSGFIFLLLLGGKASIDERCKLRLEKQELENIVSFYLGSGDIAKKALQLFHTCGFEYNIKYGSGPVDKVEILLGSSEQISGHLDPLFYGIEISDEYVLVCIDGVIESMGEIEPLLQWSTENKRKSILLARRFSPDVSNTLRTNWESKKLHVIPYIVDDLGLQAASKICKDTISSDTGLRLHNIELDSYDSFKAELKSGSSLQISCLASDSSDFNVDFLFPARFKHVHELMKERAQFAIALTKNCLLKGVSLVNFDNSKIKVPTLCLDYALGALKEWKKIENVDCVVSLEQKNSLSKP